MTQATTNQPADRETAYWLGFHLVPGIGSTRLARLIDRFGSLAAAWEANPAALRASGLSERATDALVQTRGRISLDGEIARIERAGVSILTMADDGYPRLLREIPSPPPILYVLGELTSADEGGIGIVGTRRATAYGREMARRLAEGLARAALTVVSGLARGIDGIAHEAALEARGRTIAVVASGLDTVYPPEHRHLAERITGAGAVVSEFPLGTKPDAANFPVRNRLISGLSRGVVVVEAPMKSGALITARFAADQGRTVFAVPGSALSAASQGTIQLLRDGAAVAASVDDILNEFDLQPRARQLALETRELLPASGPEQAILELVGSEPRHIDEVALDTGIPIGQLSALLLEMQLKGFVRNVGTQHYVRA